MNIDSPFPYSFTAKALLGELGIDPTSFSRDERRQLLADLGVGVFFNAEDFGADRMVAGFGVKPWPDFFAEALALKQISDATFLTRHAGRRRESLAFFPGDGFRNNMRVDTCPAFVARRLGAAGSGGMTSAAEPIVPSDFFHFPDGNASIARLLVNRRVPRSFAGVHDRRPSYWRHSTTRRWIIRTPTCESGSKRPRCAWNTSAPRTAPGSAPCA